MPWYHAIAESEHELQNPTSSEKVRLLGERLRLGPRSHVLDVASGRGGPAIVLARSFGCRITCVERAEEFHAVARRRVHEAGLDGLVELVQADAREFPLEEEQYDAALCLGASFVWDGLDGTLAALTPAAVPRGFVAVGEPYWRSWPLPGGYEPDVRADFLPLRETVARFEAAELAPVTLIAASEDDWDNYVTPQWLAIEQWLRDNLDDPDAGEIRALDERHRDRYLRWERELLGWAIVVGRKP